MKLQQQLEINAVIISTRNCPTCRAGMGHKCRDNGRQWDQAVHKERFPDTRIILHTVKFHHHKRLAINVKGK